MSRPLGPASTGWPAQQLQVLSVSEGNCEDKTGDLQVGADLVIYIDHSDIREGCMGQLKEGVRRLVDVIEQLEPQPIGYGFHFDEGESGMTVTAVHPDSASLELHMEVGREEFRKLGGRTRGRQR